MKKHKYLYQGPVFNGDVIYCIVKEFTSAYTQAQALLFLQRRISKEKGLEVWLDSLYIRRI